MATSELYDPERRAWSKTGDMQIMHSKHTATLMRMGPKRTCAEYCGRVLAVGAIDDPAPSPGVETYDYRTGQWKPAPDTNETRYTHAAVLLRDGRVLVVGGGNIFRPLVVAEVFDPSRGAWVPTGNSDPITMMAGHTATTLQDGKVLVVGNGAKPGSLLYDPEALPNPDTPEVKGGAWSLTESPEVARSYHTATLLKDGKVLIAGGSTPARQSGENLAQASERFRRSGRKAEEFEEFLREEASESGKSDPDMAELFDPNTSRWIQTGSTKTGAAAAPSGAIRPGIGGTASGDIGSFTYAGFTATLLKDGRVLRVGGGFVPRKPGGSPLPVNKAELYTPAGDTGSVDAYPRGEGKRRMIIVGTTATAALIVLVVLELLSRRRRRSG